MKLSFSEVTLAVVIVGGVSIVAWQFLGNSAASTGTPTVDVKVPVLSEVATEGRHAFDANCSQCHGKNAAGTDKGPPLVHDIYNPGHHADEAFVRAAHNGVQKHHWSFGNMPPAAQVRDADLPAIIRYVRELQEANGIFYKPHQM